MKEIIKVLLCVGTLLLAATPCTATDAFVGIVKTLEGSATIIRNGETLPAATGMEIRKADIVTTSRQSKLGLVFSDDTRISMGANTKIAVDEYLFRPKDQRLAFILNMIRGTVSFLSGQIAKLSPESVQLVMPAATIGVRGTHVLIKVD